MCYNIEYILLFNKKKFSIFVTCVRRTTREASAVDVRLVHHAGQWSFHKTCIACKSRIPIGIFGTDRVCREEVRWNEFVLDVGVVQNDSVVGAVEVCVTHKCTDAKLEALNDSNLAWCEVSANEVLRSVKDESFELCVMACGSSVCDDCLERERRALIHQREQEMKMNAIYADLEREQHQRVIKRAREQCPVESTSNEEALQWTKLTRRIMQSIVQHSEELGLSNKQCIEHTEAILNEKVILSFGKHSGKTLEYVKQQDWPYLLWLAGYDRGRMNDVGRAERRRPGYGSNYITQEIEDEAMLLVRGCCFECRTQIGDFSQNPWKTWCRRCFKALKDDT